MTPEARAERYHRKLSHCMEFSGRVEILADAAESSILRRDADSAATHLIRIQTLCSELREKLEREA